MLQKKLTQHDHGEEVRDARGGAVVNGLVWGGLRVRGGSEPWVGEH